MNDTETNTNRTGAADNPPAEELLKENQRLKRKLMLAENNFARTQLVISAQNRVDTIMYSSLRKELQFFDLVLKYTTNILLLFDYDGRFAYASATFLAIADVANIGLINGKHYKEVLEPIISAENLNAIAEAVEQSVSIKATVSLDEKIDFNFKGSPNIYSIHITPMTDEDEKITGIMARFVDITEINNAMETAKRASLAKSEFLANMSHEIRTPLNAIIGMTDVGESAVDMKRMLYCFSKIRGASNHLLGVINDILDMSKIEAHKLELSPVEYDFEDMLRKTLNIISFRIDERKQNFRMNIDDAIPKSLIGDDQRLAQVVTNLIGNAVKFTQEGGSITLNARLLSEADGVCAVRIDVSDTGIGISPDQQSLLFGSFQQAESNTARKYGGTGLGLSISKSIVEMMGGKIWVESELGKGSTFSFTFKANRGAEKVSAQRVNIRWESVRMLAVDDDPDILAFFSKLTRKWGAYGDVAASGEDALALVGKNGDYHFYFIDLKMPGMDGIQLTRELKGRKPGDGCFVIMITSSDLSLIEAEAKKAGVDRFISKPLFTSAVLDIISEILGAKSPGEPDKKDEVNFAGKRILLAEDMEINREIVTALLEPTNIEIDCAENGRDAVRMFAEAPERYDMIFMDVQMPEMDGYEATRNIRTLDIPRAEDIPIVAMTANVFNEDIEHCLEAGMNGHIGKPIDVDEIIKILRAYL